MPKDLKTVRFEITIQVTEDGTRHSVKADTISEVPLFEALGALEYVKQMLMLRNNVENMKQWLEEHEKFKQIASNDTHKEK